MKSSYGSRFLLLALIAMIGTGCLASRASATIGPELARFGKTGTGAGQLRAAKGIAADPDTGHLFIADEENNRISEFTAWGEFVKAWGWGVADGTNEELQTCTSTCFAGSAGGKAGQLSHPGGIAVAENGDIYVFERSNQRVQVFSSTGEFVRLFGGGVDHTTNADICTAADEEAGDECGAGIEGTGPSEFSIPPLTATNRDYLDINAAGIVYVGDKDRIQEFELDGTYKGSIPLPSPGNPGGLSVDDASGDLYFIYGGEAHVPHQALRLSSGGAVVYELPEKQTGADGNWTPTAAAADSEGNVFLAQEAVPGPNGFEPGVTPRVLQIDSTGEITDSCCADILDLNGEIPAVTSNVVTAGGGTDLYIIQRQGTSIFVEVRGPAPDKWPPPPAPPVVEDQFASTVSTESAVVKAEINPEFWPDTRYFLEYGEADCSGGGCTQVPAPPGKLLGAGGVKRPVTTDGTLLAGLQPGTTYHYRFIAESSGGGPVYGPDQTFTTYALPRQPQGGCPNAAFRIGAAAALSDCRAYELVSPVDKNGGELDVPGNSGNFPVRLEQSEPGGDQITYSAAGSFAGALSAGYVSQYLATRGPGGWSNAAISPPRANGSLSPGGVALDSPFKAFLPDLSSGWVLQDSDLLLTPDAQPGMVNLYRRDNVTGSYEALTTAPPLASTGTAAPAPILEGFSADGQRTVFGSTAKLTANASNAGGFQLYEGFEGKVRLVSVLPNGSAAKEAVVGSDTNSFGSHIEGRNATGGKAVSASGDRIYWNDGTIGSVPHLYVRVNGVKTLEVASAATFWSATPDGSKALYSQSDGALKLFDLTSKSSVQIASGAVGVLGASDDLSRVYFVSNHELAAGAAAGKPNLFLYETGSPIRFIATLSGNDGGAEPHAYSPIVAEQWRHVSRVTPDGSVAVFMSTGSLTGAANIDQQSGYPDAEVFRYDADTGQLRCLSCSPTGARPSGGKATGHNPIPDLGIKSPTYWYASRIPGMELKFHEPRALSSDGSRVFFDSVNRLTLSDTNGREDVYQWEQLGTDECSPSAPGFDAKTGGCVTLVSNGQGPARSEFIDASEDGHDVFFLTATSLLPQDLAQLDLYDARVDGGFPAPPAPPAACEGEACQGPPSPPNDPVPGSSTYRGAGNVKVAARRCPKGKRRVKRKGKTACVRRGKKAHHQKHKKHHRKPGGSK
jgi:NHL repeat-containing protein